MHRFNKEVVIIIAVALGFVGLMALLFWKGPEFSGTETIKDPAILIKQGSHMTGKQNAKVTIIEFGDYQCPACAMAYPILKQLVSMYAGTGSVNFVFRNFPLPQHANALVSAEAAEAAGAQGKYWEMHDMLYERQHEWENSNDALAIFVKYSAEIGLDVNRFRQEVAANTYDAVITGDARDGNSLSVNHTPTIYINGVEQPGYGLEALKAKIESELSK